jgi:hypothetical protein
MLSSKDDNLNSRPSKGTTIKNASDLTDKEAVIKALYPVAQKFISLARSVKTLLLRIAWPRVIQSPIVIVFSQSGPCVWKLFEFCWFRAVTL